MMDLTGQTFERFTVVREAERRGMARCWLCKCACGVEKIVLQGNLRNGHQRSCGCLQREMIQNGNNLRHGKTRTPEWMVWVSMRKRCNNPNDGAYANYGGRGIQVCKRWTDDFANFLADMGARPKGHSIDRIDTDGNYTPKNCRWATWKQQQRNKRTNRIVTFREERRCLADWCERLQLPYHRTQQRLDLGWSVARAFSERVS